MNLEDSPNSGGKDSDGGAVDHDRPDHDRPDHDAGDRETSERANGGRVGRATGSEEGGSIAERASKMCQDHDVGGGERAIGSDERQDFVTSLLRDAGYGDGVESEFDAAREFYKNESAAPGERVSGWSVQDLWAEDIKQEVYLAEKMTGAALMGKAYVEMRLERTIGNDKYFHCKGNCEATAVGPGGEDAAKLLSDLRESSDAQRGKNSDSDKDQEANRYGREVGRSGDGTRCAAECYDRFRYRREK